MNFPPEIYRCLELDEVATEFPEFSGLCDQCGQDLEDNHINLTAQADDMRKEMKERA